MEEGNERYVLPEFITPTSVELVRYMRDEKGITFEHMSEEEAVVFLDRKNFYDTLVPQGESRSDAARMIGATRERMLMHESWFRGCNDVKYFLSFLDALFAAMEDRLKGRGRQAD